MQPEDCHPWALIRPEGRSEIDLATAALESLPHRPHGTEVSSERREAASLPGVL